MRGLLAELSTTWQNSRRRSPSLARGVCELVGTKAVYDFLDLNLAAADKPIQTQGDTRIRHVPSNQARVMAGPVDLALFSRSQAAPPCFICVLAYIGLFRSHRLM